MDEWTPRIYQDDDEFDPEVRKITEGFFKVDSAPFPLEDLQLDGSDDFPCWNPLEKQSSDSNLQLGVGENKSFTAGFEREAMFNRPQKDNGRPAGFAPAADVKNSSGRRNRLFQSPHPQPSLLSEIRFQSPQLMKSPDNSDLSSLASPVMSRCSTPVSIDSSFPSKASPQSPGMSRTPSPAMSSPARSRSNSFLNLHPITRTDFVVSSEAIRSSPTSSRDLTPSPLANELSRIHIVSPANTPSPSPTALAMARRSRSEGVVYETAALTAKMKGRLAPPLIGGVLQQPGTPPVPLFKASHHLQQTLLRPEPSPSCSRSLNDRFRVSLPPVAAAPTIQLPPAVVSAVPVPVAVADSDIPRALMESSAFARLKLSTQQQPLTGNNAGPFGVFAVGQPVNVLASNISPYSGIFPGFNNTGGVGQPVVGSTPRKRRVGAVADAQTQDRLQKTKFQ